MIRTAIRSFRIIHSEKSFLFFNEPFGIIPQTLSKGGEENMNANGIIRGYMACHMKVDSFASHVAHCLRRQLLEFEPTAIFHMDHHTNFFLFYGQAFGQTFQLLLTFAEVEMLKAKGPYALDRYIWEEIQTKGFPIENTTHYLQTVLGEK
jgi:hypothetical protein